MLVHAEQGLGDTLQFARYVPMLAARGGRVVLEVPPELCRLLAGLAGVAELVPHGAPLPRVAVQVPLLSLPGRFGTGPDTIPAATPYLRAEPGAVAAWRARLGAASGLNVGIAWAGSRLHRNDRHRSVALDRLAPLARIPGARLFALQVGAAAAELGPAGLPIHDLAPDIADFADSAAIVTALDLVVTIDSALAHLAGALARPVWVLVPFAPDWRWGMTGESTPWYPTMRLFRQRRPGDWDEPVGRVAAALAALADARASPPGR